MTMDTQKYTKRKFVKIYVFCQALKVTMCDGWKVGGACIFCLWAVIGYLRF